MKKKERRQSFKILISILALMLIFLGSVQAEEQPDNGQYNVIDPTLLTVESDKTEVNDGDKVKIAVSFENPIGAELSNVTLEAMLPDGVTGKNTSKTFEHVTSGEKITFTVDAKVGVPAAAVSGSQNPITGADAFGAAAILAVLLILVAAGMGIHTRHKGKKLLSFVLALVLTAQMGASVFIRPAQAEEGQEEETCLTDITQTATADITVNGTKQQITAKLVIGEARPVDTGEMITDILETSDTVATGARFFTVVVNAPKDKIFKEKIDTKNITLSNAFDKAVLSDVSRLSEQTLKLRFTGPLDPEDTTCGIINFAGECFENAGNAGSVIVDVSKPHPYFAEDDGCLKFDGNGQARLVFTIDTAEFSPEITAADFSFDNPAIKAVDLTIPSTESGRDGIITIQAEDATQTETLNHLRETTMTIDSHGLNCDAISMKLTLDPSPVQAALTLGNITIGEDQATAAFSGTVQASEGCAVNLNSGSISLSNPELDGVTLSDINVTGAESFDFTVTINKTPELTEWFEDNSTLTELFTCWGYSQHLELGEGVITNVYGVGEAAGCYDLEINKSIEEYGVANAASTETAFTCTSQILSSASAFLSGDVLGGIAGLFGLGNTALDTTGQKLDAIQSSLNDLNTKTDEINQNIENLSKEMQDAIKKNSDEKTREKISTFGEKVDDLSWTVNKVNGKNSNLIVKTMNPEIKEEDYKKNVDKINGIVKSSDGGGDTFSRNTLALGKDILGEGLSEKDSIFDIYTGLIDGRYNWKSEAKTDKESFMAYALNIYIKAYMISMCYMQSNNENGIYDNAVQQLMQQFKQIAEKEASMEAAMTPKEGTDVCMITGQTYDLNAFEIFDLPAELQNPAHNQLICGGRINPYVPFDTIFDEISKRNFQERYEILFDKNTLETMKKRLNASGQKTLADEMRNAGFNLPANEVYAGNLSDDVRIVQNQGIFRVVTSYTFMIDTVSLDSGQYNTNRNQTQMMTTKMGMNPARYNMQRQYSKICAKKGGNWSPVNWPVTY